MSRKLSGMYEPVVLNLVLDQSKCSSSRVKERVTDERVSRPTRPWVWFQCVFRL
jgi:hypothetical protein